MFDVVSWWSTLFVSREARQNFVLGSKKKKKKVVASFSVVSELDERRCAPLEDKSQDVDPERADCQDGRRWSAEMDAGAVRTEGAKSAEGR